MPEIEPIIDVAREVLVGRSPLGREDTFLFDHSMRVMRVAERLSGCREVRAWRLDRFALSVAALFHQAATVRLEEERRTSTVYAAATMSAEDVKQYSANWSSSRRSSATRTTPPATSRSPRSSPTPTASTISAPWASGGT